MTKTVNSISLRVGYNLFWLHKKSNLFTFFTFNSVFFFLQKEFRKKLIVCFKIKLSIDEILLNVYNLSINYKHYLKLDKLHWKFLVLEGIQNKKHYNRVINRLRLIKKIHVNNYYVHRWMNYCYKMFTLYSKFQIWAYKIMFYKFISFNNISSLWKYNNFNKVIESFIKSFHAKDIYLIKRYINLSEFNYLVNLKKKKIGK